MDYTQDNEQFIAKGWDAVSAKVKENSNSDYIKLQAGESVVFSVVGQPEFYSKKWDDKPEPSERVKVDVFVVAENILKTWDMPAGTYKSQLNFQRDRHRSDFTTSLFELSRQGTGKSTRWRLDYLRQMTAEETVALEKLDPTPL